MSDIFDEVSEDMRRLQLDNFWKENGRWVIAGAVLAVVFTATLSTWRWWQSDRAVKATYDLSSVLKENNQDKALIDYAASADAGHAAIATLYAAGDLASKGEEEKAIALYDDIALRRGVDKIYRGLAQILSSSLKISTGKTEGVDAVLEKLSADDSAWRFSARELQALLAASNKDYKKAADILEALSGDGAAPQNLRTRAFTLRDFYLSQEG